MLNVGSSTKEFRTVTQPWIDSYLFAPARKNGLTVVHTDIKATNGVDIVGDLTDHQFRAKLSEKNFRSALCANLFEHVTNRTELSRAIESVVTPGGLIIVTCPYKYPYHPDPIDTGYRPTPDELAQLFPSTRVVRAEIVDCGTHIERLLKNPRLLFRTLLRLCMPFYKPAMWWETLRLQAWLFRRLLVTCVVLEKSA
jgi:hypothetical protein